ncbi:SusC/RagA family TonB-linked outer membrane protein [Fodinibius sediminis]|nr:SusC/RagA family TonB-linked outer membrane protein [Fodinibius sediminis]
MLCNPYAEAQKVEDLLAKSRYPAMIEDEAPYMTQKVSLNARDQPLKEILAALEDKVPIIFSYRENILDETGSYSIQVTEVSFKEALAMIFEHSEIEYLPIKGGYVVLKKKTPKQQEILQTTLTGTVTDAETGEVLPGANVSIAGTTQGASTGEDGQFTITDVEPGTYELVATFIGYQESSREVTISEGQETVTVNFELQSEATSLEEMVVTAFNVQREQRSLGTAVGNVTGEEIAESPNLNVANSLSGKVSGVRVSSASSGSGGSSRVIIRGNTSLGGNNQPLYVVDGVPIDNTNRGSAGRWGGYDRGDGIQNINSNDIAEISVLKGPNAAALYGQRGANGVILITTKSGGSREGIGVEINSSITLGEPWILPDYQNKYGLGNEGSHRFYNDGNGKIISRAEWNEMGQPGNYTPQITTINDGTESPVSWGPRMDGSEVYTWDGKLMPFSPQPNNVRDFYNTETTYENSLALTGGNESTTFRLSLANVTNNGLLPQNRLKKNTVNFRGSHQFTDRFSAEAQVNFVSQDVDNRPGLSDQQRNVAYAFRYMPRNTRLESLYRYELTQEDLQNPNGFHGYTDEQLTEGYTRHWTNATFTEQPYWTVNNTTANDTRQRIIGHVSLQYDLSDWASLSAKASRDTYTDQFFNYSTIGTRVDIPGSMSESVDRFREDNVEFLASAEKAVTEDITVTGNIGGNYLKSFYRSVGQSGNRFSVPDLITIGNTEVQSTSFGLSEYEIHSLFAFGQISFRDFWYIDWTARNDWSSTLPADNASFFYPSISTNFIWSDALGLDSDVLSYGSVRASWAQAGNSGDPYQLTGTYSLANETQDGRALANFTNTIPLQDLENELTTSIEVGTDFRFFSGRLRADITYYNAVTENQILSIAVPPSSGFTNKRINAGEIKNQGIELLLSGTPIQYTGGFQWDISLNYATNQNEVVALTEGVESFQLGIDRGAIITANPGQPYGEIYSAAARWLRDEAGNRLINPNTGLPIRETGQYRVGNAVPDWTGGITNTFRYRGFDINSLIDISQGGLIVSMSNVNEAIHGTTKRTLKGRDGTLVAEGVIAEPDGNGGWTSTGQENTMQISAEDYWTQAAPGSEQSVAEAFTNDASYIALREVSIGYTFPSLVERLSVINSLRFSIIGRNLLYLERHTDGFSPESASFNVSSNSIGLESAAFPMTRNVRFNLSLGL